MKVKYVGKEKTRQYPGGHWLELDQILEVDESTGNAFIETTDFVVVDDEPIKMKPKKVKVE